ncbi:hypothetical protein Tco_0885488 [Tanacetum coccineum]
MSALAKRHKENSNMIKEIQASTNAVIRNQGALIKTLEIQIGQMSKVLQERGFGSLPSSTKSNPRDHVKSISTTVEANTNPIRHMGSSQYAVSTSQNNFIILNMPEDVKVPLILGRLFLSTSHAKIDVFKRKITLRVGDEKIIFKSMKPASSLIKRVYMLSLRERMELDLEARLLGETLVLKRSLNPLYGDYIELNDINEPLKLRSDQVDDLMPTIEEGPRCKEIDKVDSNQSSGILVCCSHAGNPDAFNNTHPCSLKLHVESTDQNNTNVDASSPRTTPIMEKIDKIEKLIINGKVTLEDKESKPLKKVASLCDYDSEDEVASMDNEMANFLAKKGGFGAQILLEQWTESYENDDYGYDPYDDDMYKGQNILDNLQAICDILDITVKGRRKKYNYGVLGKISKKARILELKRRHLKITVLTSNTPYPSRKIRHIYVCTSQKTTKETRSIRRIQRRPIRHIQALEIKCSRRYRTWSLLQETPDTPY